MDLHTNIIGIKTIFDFSNFSLNYVEQCIWNRIENEVKGKIYVLVRGNVITLSTIIKKTEKVYHLIQMYIREQR